MEDVKNNNVDQQVETNPGEEEKNEGEVKAPENNPVKKTFTQEELEKIIDKRLARERTKLEEEKKKAEQLATMTAEERLKEQLKEKDNLIQEYLTKAQKAELKNKTTKKLKETGLDTSLSDFLMGQDEEETEKKIEAFKNVWDAAMEKAVTANLSVKTPKNPKVQDTKIDPLLKAFDKAGW